MSDFSELPPIFQQKKETTSSQNEVNSMEKKASDVIADLAQKYPSWAITDVLKLKKSLNDAKSLSGEARIHLIQTELYKTAHDIKGQGATFGYPLMTELGAHLCRFIKSSSKFDREEMDQIKQDIDDMERVIREKISGDGGQVGYLILGRLQGE